MLSSETKRKIDNARDILVGKIPVPSAQIELITIALIYKFMSDIDTQNKELGADGFFVGEYEKYAWSNIMDRKIGAHDRLYLYSEWLDKMGTNTHLPQMFRDIFRNAFLPFKDPQTLDRFLKQINEFSYDHSEELGNAFEYLLSTAGSQWDAGQFRTPRHIIDFIVQVVEPKHTDTILDPACGTAWFLISAYKYIMGQNQDKAPWDKLTLAQKNMLTKNFVGYDISHEMVRLSLVNMYLHNFWDPHIYEYDTLSSDERRDDRFDCILANPPFMTPKGGIQPHSRFSIKASKSEVLFVDYMMEHLNPHGKAGIIVPEGIIFQSANAYKSLRKKMIEENYLRAVVSLPSGVFQPYSWVKTSILLFDKELAKKSDDILFVKVNNDGFDLWAQRRATPDKDDLPKVLEELLEYKKSLHNESVIASETSVISSEVEKSLGFAVPKAQIIENGDYNLSVERYRVAELMNSDWPMVELGEVCEFIRWVTYSKNDEVDEWWTSILRANNIDLDWTLNLNDIKKIDISAKVNKKQKLKQNDIMICTASWSEQHIWKVTYISQNLEMYFWWFMGVLRSNNLLHSKYLYYQLRSKKFRQHLNFQIAGANIRNINYWIISSFKIPLPPLEIQEQIVAELNSYQKIVDWAKQIVENYKPTIKIDPEWEMVEFSDIAELSSWKFMPSKNIVEGSYPVYWGNWINNYHNEYFIENPTIVIGRVWEYCWATHLTKWKSRITDNALYITKYFREINQNFLLILLQQANINQYAKQWGQPSISQSTVKEIKFSLPPIEIQNQIVAEIEKEQAMVDSAKGLIEVFEGKVKEKIGEVWGE